MGTITLSVGIAVIVLGLSVKRAFRRSQPGPSDTSTYHKMLALHIANTTRSAGRNL